MKTTDITNGDIVKLRDGRLITVDGISAWYEDASGRHEGPWVMTRNWDRFLVADVLEVVTPNTRKCIYCGSGVTSTNPDVQFCRGCFYSGIPMEAERLGLMNALREIDGVDKADIWHTGGGCFLLAITLDDGRIITATESEALLPDPGDPWGLVVVAEDQDAHDEWDEERLTAHEFFDGGSWADGLGKPNLTDDGLVDFVKDQVTGNA